MLVTMQPHRYCGINSHPRSRMVQGRAGNLIFISKNDDLPAAEMPKSAAIRHTSIYGFDGVHGASIGRQ